MGLTDISTPISVAKSILEHSPHNVICGEGALKWALERGFQKSPTFNYDDTMLIESLTIVDKVSGDVNTNEGDGGGGVGGVGGGVVGGSGSDDGGVVGGGGELNVPVLTKKAYSEWVEWFKNNEMKEGRDESQIANSKGIKDSINLSSGDNGNISITGTGDEGLVRENDVKVSGDLNGDGDGDGDKDDDRNGDRDGDKDGDKDGDESHDTIGLICLDSNGHLACGTSTSGWKFKYPGRVGKLLCVG